jgi:hypothetical protein
VSTQPQADTPRYPPYLRLPDPDRVLSPMTGWTRAHWETLADHLLESAARYATPDFAQFRLPGRLSRSGLVSDGIEGFARTFLLAAFRIAGAGPAGSGRTPVPSESTAVSRLAARYAEGIAAGTRRGSPSAWPEITDCSQQMVEAAAIAIALHETRPWIWDKLDRRSQDDVRAWLGSFVGKRPHPNNWLLFQVVTEQFLAEVGGDYDQTEIERGLEAIEAWYLGDGWYTDGAGQNFDYYIGWAMHLYPLMWSRIAGESDGGRAQVYRKRLREFLGQYQYFFGADGAPVHQGRSLTYRYACAAPLWLGELFGATPLQPGQTRRLASGVVRHFTERGVPDQDGLLSLGWYAPFLPVTQTYSGPGSPYWASKAFVGLLLPPEHPAWTDTERPALTDIADQAIAMPAPGFLLHSTRQDGIVRLLNHGSDHNTPRPAPPETDRATDDPHYARLAYSSCTAPGTSDPAWRANLDNHVAVIAADGTPSRRIRIDRIAVDGRQASSRYVAALPGSLSAGSVSVSIETAVLVRGPWEIRAHLVRAPTGLTVRDGGYEIADAVPLTTAVGGSASPWASAVRPGGLATVVVGLHGWAEAGVSEHVQATAFGPRSAAPYLLSGPRQDTESVHVSLVVLTGDAVDPEALAAALTAEVVAAQPHGWRVHIGMPGDSAELTLAGHE